MRNVYHGRGRRPMFIFLSALPRTPSSSAGHRIYTCCVALVLAALQPMHAMASVPGRPIFVELFTSEGCSSCPPADALLAGIARTRPDVIALSEHVSYWNYLGWTDPFSSTESTARQTDYAQRFGGEGPYTPQMVVNGRRQFVGSDRSALETALRDAAADPGPALAIAVIASSDPSQIAVTVTVAASSSGGHVIAVLVQNAGQAQVPRGENAGRTLMHVDIARQFRDLGPVRAHVGFAGEPVFVLPSGAAAAGFHIVAFVQAGPGGEILAAASTSAP